MKAAAILRLLLTHPLEFRTLVQYYLYHEQKRDLTAPHEHPTSGWDRATMRRCWGLLDETSRSFAMVVKELEGDLARTICIFYIVLRALDTVEDDMTIPESIKQPLLRSFHEKSLTPGWTFTGSGPNEKDRQVLIEYDVVIEEIGLLEPKYREVIIDICRKMQNGMADYTAKASASNNTLYLEKVEDYDLYCHYVAGLVGEGLSRIWSASGKEAVWLGDQLELSNSMGLLLQKTNIIRDFREDVDEKRFFWPREIWGRKEYGFSEMKEMAEPQNVQRAMWAQSGMVVNAMSHTIDSLDYLRLLKNQSVFNFCAIPAAMAIATLELCFMNPTMFQTNIKIRKAAAASLVMRSTNPREVALIFRDYSRKIHAKATPSDPNFLAISVACGKIEQWCEHYYPSFIALLGGGPSGAASQQVMNPEDARTRIFQAEKKRTDEKRLAAGQQPLANPAAQNAVISFEMILYIGGAFAVVIAVTLGLVWLMLLYIGEGKATPIPSL